MDERVGETPVTSHDSDGDHGESVERSLHDVFVSYSTYPTLDHSIADEIVSRLEQAGVRCWVTPRVIPPWVWDEEIVQAMEAGRLTVVVLSRESSRVYDAGILQAIEIETWRHWSHAQPADERAPADCHGLMVVYMYVRVSGESDESREVLRKVERAVANDVVVVLLRIESVRRTGVVPYCLSLDCTAHLLWFEPVSSPRESHIERFVQRLLVTLRPSEWREAAPSLPPPPVPAPLPAGSPPPASVRTPLPRIATISVLALIAAFLTLALLL